MDSFEGNIISRLNTPIDDSAAGRRRYVADYTPSPDLLLVGTRQSLSMYSLDGNMRCDYIQENERKSEITQVLCNKKYAAFAMYVPTW